MKIEKFTNTSAPITVIVNITNPVAVKLAKILLEQGSRLLIVDKLSLAKKRMLGDLLRNENCLFMDSESTFRNIEKFKKIDYIYYFLSQITAGSSFPNLAPENMDIVQLEHKDFIRESNRIDAYLKLGLEFEATVSVITSAYVSQFLEGLPELNIQIQKYAESLTKEYVSKNKLNARILRLGELIGENCDMTSPTNLARLVRELLMREKVNIFGDGLQQNYLVHVEDAVYAILNATFSKEAKGKTYMVVYPNPFTSLGIAYQLLELTTEEKQVVFNEVLPDHDQILKLRDICIAPSVSAIGWEPQITLEQALSETVAAVAKQLNYPWKPVEKFSTIKISNEEGSSDEDLKVQSKPNRKNTTTVFVMPNFIRTLYKKLVVEPIFWFKNIPKNANRKIIDIAPKVRSASARWLVGILTAIISVVILTPYIHFSVTAVKLYSLQYRLRKDLTTMDTSNVEDYATKLPIYVDGMLSDYKAIRYWKYVPKVNSLYSSFGNFLDGMSLYSKSLSVSIRAASPVIDIVKGVSNISPNTPAGQVSRDYYTQIVEIMKYRNEISQATQDAKVAQLRISKLNSNKLPNFARVRYEKLVSLLTLYTETLTQTEKVYDLIPYLLGYKDRRTYFLMMQNETELRSTGGWFSNYAIVGIENGQVRELTVDDIYNTDGQIKGLTAPVDMKQGLGVDTYKLSLSNWSPELSTVSKNIEDLLGQKNIYKPNDVTITMNFSVISKLLEIVGPIKTDSLGEITGKNLFDKIGQLHSKFVPGSTEKISVVSDFMPKLLEAIIEASPEKKQEVINSIVESINENHIMVYSTNLELRTKILDEYNTYREVRNIDSPVFAVDWNWGGNKANRYVKRELNVDIDETKSVANIYNYYTNESTAEAYPQGKYVNIQRFYYPSSFVFKSSSGYSVLPRVYVSENATPYVLGRIEVGIRSSQETKLVFGITQMPNKLSLLKQSGIDSEVVHVTIKQATVSNISDQVLTAQEFSKVDGVWKKTYIRKGDIVINLR